MALSFKLEFPYSNNTVEYEAYLTELATALKMGVKHLKVMGDSKLVVYPYLRAAADESRTAAAVVALGPGQFG